MRPQKVQSSDYHQPPLKRECEDSNILLSNSRFPVESTSLLRPRLTHGIRTEVMQMDTTHTYGLLMTFSSKALLSIMHKALHPLNQREACFSQSAHSSRQVSLLPILSGSLALGPLQQVSKVTEGLTIGTRVAGTPVYFLLTVRAGEVGRAFAGITGPLVALPARAPIEAG